ncbi:sulfite exporter TauE/SafE family protein [Pseudoclavibacter soli]|uniref:sulfite exporter TauE/SafE family protein n=1 Tax=Pseudoclavibacter soli TaxID=452623 RepID=UPI000403B589|nr:sulfite exporter TauE/SafE family protein [Pseudoclavibacter soli]
MHSSPLKLALAALLGLAAGVLSGLFGVGGGIIIVPGLVLILGVGAKMASGTSLAATMPIAATGIITYAAHGSLDLYTGCVIGAGSFVGAFAGAWLLARIRPKALQVLFALLIIATAIKMLVDLPTGEGALEPTLTHTLVLLSLGLSVGVLAGLLGIGGGLIIVPVLIIGLGVDATLAKGASLVSILPTGISGTWANLRNANVNLKLAALVGVPGAFGAVIGGMLVQVIDQGLATGLLVVLLLFTSGQMLWKALRRG